MEEALLKLSQLPFISFALPFPHHLSIVFRLSTLFIFQAPATIASSSVHPLSGNALPFEPKKFLGRFRTACNSNTANCIRSIYIGGS
jgi:hypothetical protein